MFLCIQYTFYNSKNKLIFKFESDFDSKLDLVVDTYGQRKPEIKIQVRKMY